MKRLLILMFVIVAATVSSHAQTVQCQTTNGAWGPCQFVSPVSTAQAVNSKVSAGAGTTITNAFGSNTTAGNSILCIAFESAAAIPVITDGQSNTYIAASSSATAPGYTVALASNIIGGTTDTITETTASGAASFSCYELKGTVSVGQLWDYVSAQQAASTAITFAAQTAAMPNEMAFVAVGMGAGTVSAPPAIAGVPSGLTTVDQSNTLPSGGSALSVFYSAHTSVTNVPTFTQAVSISGFETFSAVLVSVKPISINETFGPVNITQTAGATLSKSNPLFTNIADGTNQLTLDLSAYGTAPTGTEALGVNAFITNTPSVGLSSGSNTVGKVDILGNLGAAVDAANNASAPANVLAIGVQEQSSGTNATAGTSGNIQRPLADLVGALFVRVGSSNPWSCVVSMSTNTTTQCEAAPSSGFRAYVTGIVVATSTAGTATTIQVEYGTSTNCGTGTTALSAKFPNTSTAGQSVATWSDPVGGLIPPAANAICVVQAGTMAGTSSVQLTGFIAP